MDKTNLHTRKDIIAWTRKQSIYAKSETLAKQTELKNAAHLCHGQLDEQDTFLVTAHNSLHSEPKGVKDMHKRNQLQIRAKTSVHLRPELCTS